MHDRFMDYISNNLKREENKLYNCAEIILNASWLIMRGSRASGLRIK